jgi:outer membrane protein assembly factor BamB
MYRSGPGHTGSAAFESAISVSNVGNLRAAFTGTSAQGDGAPIVAGGVLYLEGFGTSSHAPELAAFDAKGSTDCSGPSCTPLWTASLPSGTGHATPAVANGVVYVSAGNLYAYDAAGNTNCSGLPKVCTPLWEGLMNSTANYSSPDVVNGVVYLGGGGSAMLYTFDASGTTNCSGSPRVCQPLWTGTVASGTNRGAVDSSPAYANGVVYIASGDGNLYAFDGNGKTNCSGSTVVCTQLWSATVGGSAPPPQTAPAVANGTVYYANGTLYAFDASGTEGCSGSPRICSPMWTGAGSAFASPAVTNSTVFVGEATDGAQSGVAAFDASGTNGCTGTPKICQPLWFDSVSGSVGLGGYSSPTVANGVLYVGGNAFGVGGSLYAFDAEGSANCSGTPKACSPLFTYSLGPPNYVFSDVTIANGTVFVRGAILVSGDTNFVALKLP